MSSQNTTTVRLECAECPFTRVVGEDDDALPADVVTEHGEATGHRVQITRIDE